MPATPQLKAIFFDAAGTLFHLPKGVGYHYAIAGRDVGLDLDARAVDRAFASTWKQMPRRETTRVPREDDDKGWWRELVDRVMQEVVPGTHELDRDAFFEAAYGHFAEAGVWELFPEVLETLEALRPHDRLAVISNFDGRLRMIVEQLGISNYFDHLIISSEVGADKPEPFIFERALELVGVAPDGAMHVGDDPTGDWEGAASVGMHVFRLDRPQNSLRDLVTACTSV